MFHLRSHPENTKQGVGDTVVIHVREAETGRSLRLSGQPAWPTWYIPDQRQYLSHKTRRRATPVQTHMHTELQRWGGGEREGKRDKEKGRESHRPGSSRHSVLFFSTHHLESTTSWLIYFTNFG